MERRPIRWRDPGSGWRVSLLIAAWAVVSAGTHRFGPYPRIAEAARSSLPEESFGWSAEGLAVLLARLGPEGRELYLRFQAIDILVVGLTTIMLVAVIQWAVGQVDGAESEWHNLALVPLVACALELVENTALFALGFLHPSLSVTLVGIGSFATRAKFVIGGAAVLIAVAAVLIAWWAMWREGRRESIRYS